MVTDWLAKAAGMKAPGAMDIALPGGAARDAFLAAANADTGLERMNPETKAFSVTHDDEPV
jgi:hypothetical protein